MYIAITGNKNNRDVYIKQSYRKENGRTSSRIYKKLGKFNDLVAQFNGDEDQMLAWAKNEAKKETALYNQKNGKVSCAGKITPVSENLACGDFLRTYRK